MIRAKAETLYLIFNKLFLVLLLRVMTIFLKCTKVDQIQTNSLIGHFSRNTLGSLLTVDVHSRDVVEKLINDKVADASEFSWTSQMRWISSVSDYRSFHCFIC